MFPLGLSISAQRLCRGRTLPKNVTLDGTSLLPLFATGKLVRPKPLYWFYNPSRPVCVIRDGDWCLLADPEIDLPRQNMFLERFIGDIKKTGFKTTVCITFAPTLPKRSTFLKRNPIASPGESANAELHRDVMDEAFDWPSLK